MKPGPYTRVRQRTSIVARPTLRACSDAAPEARAAASHTTWQAPRRHRNCFHYAHRMIREADAIVRKQRFLLCRYLLILVTGTVGFLETAEGSPMPVAVLVGLAVFSNLFLGTVPPFSFFDATMQAPILVTDTALISAVLLVSRASQEFFLFFFFIMIMAAKIENLVALAAGAALIGLTSLLFTDLEAGWLSPLLMRIPFLLACALFYGYVVLPERTGQMTPLRGGRVTVVARPVARVKVSA
jgi:hypothetical protein